MGSKYPFFYEWIALVHDSFLLVFSVVVAVNVLIFENKKLVALCQASKLLNALLAIEMESGIVIEHSPFTFHVQGIKYTGNKAPRKGGCFIYTTGGSMIVKGNSKQVTKTPAFLGFFPVVSSVFLLPGFRSCFYKTERLHPLFGMGEEVIDVNFSEFS